MLTAVEGILLFCAWAIGNLYACSPLIGILEQIDV